MGFLMRNLIYALQSSFSYKKGGCMNFVRVPMRNEALARTSLAEMGYIHSVLFQYFVV